MLLFTYFIVYFSLVFVVRSLLLWKKTGVNPLTFSKSDDAHGFNGKTFKFISMIELIVVGIYAFKNDWNQYLLPFWYLENKILAIIGWSLLILSLIVVWIAQTHMANSWRIGIDKENRSELVTSGFFSISRNPIFLGLKKMKLGCLPFILQHWTIY